MSELPEILLVDKPKGITSFDVIRRLRKQTNTRKFGHAGTLDPLATGLMIIGAGAGTKRLTEFIKLDKEYVAEVLLGKQTTTGDMEGEVIAEKKVEEGVEILRSKISTELTNMIDTLTLPVSAYSAIKKDGVPMYKHARAAETTGETVEVSLRDMTVYEAELLDITSGDGVALATVRFHVGSGTYIRSLGEELGKRLGYPATLQNLRRTKIGDFTIDQAQQIEEVG